MPVLKPFKAVHYNLKKVKDLKKVVSPPYDVISEEEQTILQSDGIWSGSQLCRCNDHGRR